MIEFRPWPKTPRLFRECIITEKIDGTNAAVHIEGGDPRDCQYDYVAGVYVEDVFYKVGAQSRNRLLSREADNFGFAAFVADNAALLAATLGTGVHYGEWRGSGIQRGYGMEKGAKRFSLFHVDRYADSLGTLTEDCPIATVPVLYRGLFDTAAVRDTVERLREGGSLAAPGYMRPEGVVTFHTASRSVYKTLLDNDDTAKSA